MSVKTLHTEPFNGNSSSADKKSTKGDPVRTVTNASSMKFSSQTPDDSLMAAFGKGMQTLPSDQHIYRHTTEVIPVGAHYEPRGEFGKMKAKPGNKSHLDKAMNKVGKNAVGSNSNRVGEKSGYPKFSPKGGGKNV